jgi:hypothetical protein
MTDLGDVVLDVAHTLPKGQRNKLVAVLRSADGPSPLTKHHILAIAAGPEFATMVGRLFRRWDKEPAVSAAGLALAIEAAGAACDRDRDRSVRPVWTGPDAGQPVRLTGSF